MESKAIFDRLAGTKDGSAGRGGLQIVKPYKFDVLELNLAK